MRTVYGYCRISTTKQSIERQIRNIKAAFPDAVIVQEAYTGTSLERPAWMKLYKGLNDGDAVVFDSVSRMSRNADEGFKLYKELYGKGVSLVFLKEHHIDTDAYKDALQNSLNISIDSGDSDADELVDAIMQAVNRFMMRKVEQDILKAFEQAEKEALDIRQRTKEGIETARLNGKQIGQVTGKKLVTKKSMQAKQDILRLSKDFDGALPNEDVIRLTGISRKTFFKYKKELRDALRHGA